MKKAVFIAEINEAELAVRLMSIAMGLKRSPTNKATPEQIIEEAKQKWPASGGLFPFGRMARAAIDYFEECIDRGQRPT